MGNKRFLTAQDVMEMQATEELTAELEILNAEKQEAESVIASVGAEIADAREEVEENKKHLVEINEQISDREIWGSLV